MSSNNNKERNSFETLQAEYRRCWLHFTTEAELLQAVLRNTPTDFRGLERARETVALAFEEYREARNALAGLLLGDGHHSSSTGDGETVVVLEVARTQAA